jgi:hypothetical protein
MKKTLGSVLIALAFVFGIIATTSTTADAQYRNRNNGGYNNDQLQQGYNFGLSVGATDGQRRQSYSPQRSRYYRDASTQMFREGFVRGYDEGYRQYASTTGNGGYRNNGSYRNDGYRNRNDGGYRNDGYRNRNDGDYDNEELNSGYQQGLNIGASDGQSRKSYSPERSRFYQNASTQAFRQGFVRGYEEGYRQYSRNGRRSNTAGSILDQIFNRRP